MRVFKHFTEAWRRGCLALENHNCNSKWKIHHLYLFEWFGPLQDVYCDMRWLSSGKTLTAFTCKYSLSIYNISVCVCVCVSVLRVCVKHFEMIMSYNYYFIVQNTVHNIFHIGKTVCFCRPALITVNQCWIHTKASWRHNSTWQIFIMDQRENYFYSIFHILKF